MIDPNEDFLRRHMKLRRNPYGSHHEIATQIAQGRLNSDDTDSVVSGVTTEISEEKISSQFR